MKRLALTAVRLRSAVRVILTLTLTWALVSTLALGGRADRADRVVLIVNASGPATLLDAIDIKRLFLGIPVQRGDVTLHALLNDSDPKLRLVFLQYVVSMTEPAYERRLLMLTLEQGRRMPRSIANSEQLMEAVATDRGAVSYAWESASLRNPRVRILRELWQG